MLVATRDAYENGSHHTPAHRPDGPGGHKPPGGGFMGALQLTGALLAIPAGLAGAYSAYRANFSVETTCQSLRAGIIATLDKNVDASTRRMLVRRDVQTFEQSCAGFDPDATAAFKGLLAADKKTATVAVAPQPARPEAAPAKDVSRKTDRAEPRVEAVAKKPEPVAAVPVEAPARRDVVTSDTKWLEAVRGALVDHAEPKVAPVAAPAPVVANVPAAPKPAAPVTAVAAPVVMPELVAAPALPPPTAVPSAPATQTAAAPPSVKADPDHPVPPEAIPGGEPLRLNPPAVAEKPQRSRLGAFMSHIPGLNRMVDSSDD